MASLRPRLLVALLLVLGACGPGVPDGGASPTTGAPTTTGDATTGDATTVMTTDTTSASGVTLPDTTSEGTGLTGPDLTSGTGSEQTTDLGPCVADPAMGICTEACDQWTDCCACEGTTFVHDPRAPSCELPMGIVTATCPWQPYEVLADGVTLPTECDGANGWTQTEHDGDLWISLCDATCAQFTAGEILVLEARMFCEAA